jgi:hypothetical protein
LSLAEVLFHAGYKALLVPVACLWHGPWVVVTNLEDDPGAAEESAVLISTVQMEVVVVMIDVWREVRA